MGSYQAEVPTIRTHKRTGQQRKWANRRKSNIILAHTGCDNSICRFLEPPVCARASGTNSKVYSGPSAYANKVSPCSLLQEEVFTLAGSRWESEPGMHNRVRVMQYDCPAANRYAAHPRRAAAWKFIHTYSWPSFARSFGTFCGQLERYDAKNDPLPDGDEKWASERSHPNSRPSSPAEFMIFGTRVSAAQVKNLSPANNINRCVVSGQTNWCHRSDSQTPELCFE